MIATHPFKIACKSVLPLWSQTVQARLSAPNACAPELFIFLCRNLFTNIKLDDFPTTLTHLLKCLDIKESEGQEWTMMAMVNIGALLYGHQQGVLQHTGTLSQMNHNPATIMAATRVKLARKA
jgi:hypothetical protein